MSTFRVGSTVIHKSHGLGKIIDIVEREFTPGQYAQFYLMEAFDKGIPKRIFVHMESSKDRLRALTPVQDLHNVLAHITKGITHPLTGTFRGKFQTYLEHMSSGKLEEIAFVFGSMLSKDTPLSFGEMKLKDNALKRLAEEIAIVLKVDEGKIVAALLENKLKIRNLTDGLIKKVQVEGV